MVIDFVGQSHFGGNVKVAAKDGRIVLLALLSGSVVKEVNLAQILFKRLRIEGTTLRSRSLEYQGALKNKFQEEGLPGLKGGKYKIFIEKTFSWKDVSCLCLTPCSSMKWDLVLTIAFHRSLRPINSWRAIRHRERSYVWLTEVL